MASSGRGSRTAGRRLPAAGVVAIVAQVYRLPGDSAVGHWHSITMGGFQDSQSVPRPGRAGPAVLLDERTRGQLESLGYVK